MAFRQIGAGSLLNPSPVVMVSCAREGGRPNIITLAWAGTVCTSPPMVSISVRPQRYSFDLIADSGEFVINLVGRDLMKACDWCGVRSGREEDKFTACGLTAVPAEGMRLAPAIAQAPAYLSCIVRERKALGSHTLFLAEIVAVGIQEELFSPDGSMDLHRADLVAYVHGEYAGLKTPEGFFGYSVARPQVLARRLRK